MTWIATIAAAFITGIFAIVGNMIISSRSSRALSEDFKRQSELADERIHGEIAVIKTEVSGLRQEVKKHNSIVERTYHLEQENAVHSEQIKAANRRLDDLEKVKPE